MFKEIHEADVVYLLMRQQFRISTCYLKAFKNRQDKYPRFKASRKTLKIKCDDIQIVFYSCLN